MADSHGKSFLSRLGFQGRSGPEIGSALGVIAILVILVVRMPSWMLDGLLAVNISFSLVLVLVALYLKEPLEFSTFPSILLLSTMFRLSLNVSSTKLILGGTGGASMAGQVIQFFGHVVSGNDTVVGFVIFLIFVLVQFIVITKGSGRVAEVAARFTLDAMAGKQMAIDADLNAGLIGEADARERRKRISQEADFYGAMDGASKFVRGDAIAGIIITLINLIGGILVGRFRNGMEMGEVFRTYALLTIGDGLVSQIPALLIATAAGMVITRASSDESLGQKMFEQFRAQPNALLVASGALGLTALMAMVTTSVGLAFPFGALSVGLFLGAKHLRKIAETEKDRLQDAEQKEKVRPPQPEAVEKLLAVDPMEIEIGYGLVPLVDSQQGGDLLERVTAIRRSLALELGLVVPPIRIRDNMQLKPTSYGIKIRGVRVASGEVRPDRLLAMTAAPTSDDVPGIDTIEPAFNLPAKWIRRSDRGRAELTGYNVIEPVAVLATHLTEVIRSHAGEILSRQEVRGLVDNLKETQPVIVEELTPVLLSVGQIQKVLQGLLKERVPIRNLGTIFEALADAATQTKDTTRLIEAARAALARVITHQYATGEGVLHVLTMDPGLEQTLGDSVQHTDRGSYIAIDAASAGKVLKGIANAYEEALRSVEDPVLLTTPQLRVHIRRLTERALPRLPILSYQELAPEIEVKGIGIVRMSNEN